MSFLDWLTGKMDCPRCGTSGAKEINGSVHCPNPTCSNYSRTMGKRDVVPAPEPGAFSQPVDVPSGSIAIQYLDFRGQARTFIAEAASTWRDKNHIKARVGRKRTLMVLSRDRIQNLTEVEGAIGQRVAPGQEWPTPRERQVLNYHKKHGTTSPLYESIRAKYPNW